jgi:hypothetical protein
MTTMPTLTLVRERKLCDLMPCDQASKRWEASGVLLKERHCFVVFDDRVEMRHADHGYEGITYNTAKQRFYLLVEARKHGKGCYKALLVEYDNEFNYLKQRPIDFIFESDNKGFEAVAHVRRDGKDYVLALCEGNMCKCGKQGRTPGGGRVQLFEKTKKCWRHIRTIALPTTVPFEDYSGMSTENGRVAVVSQVNSMLWIGQFNEADWTWHDDGQLFEFPRCDNGSIRYGNIEGVAWITPTRVVTVSDRRKKKDQPDKGLSDKDQSIHIFDIPI